MLRFVEALRGDAPDALLEAAVQGMADAPGAPAPDLTLWAGWMAEFLALRHGRA